MKLESLQQSRMKATFTITPEDFEHALDEAFTTVVKNVKVDGFRPGHCPRPVFEKKFGVESLYEEALNVIFNKKVQEVYASKEVSEKVIGQFEPAVETKDFARGKEFEVSLSFDVLPEVTLPQYKGLEVKKQVLEATEDEVMNAVKAELNNHSTLKEKAEQVIASGDTAKFDFVGTIDGKAFDGGSAENYELQIGSGQFIPGFEDQMIGMKKDEVKDINVNFPDNYPAKDLAGKPAVFKVTIHEVKETVLPELNDEFVKSLNLKDINTVEELKKSKKDSIEASKKTSERDRQIDELFNQIIDNTKVELPQALVADYQQRMKSQYEQQAKMYNIPLETFLSIMGTTAEKFDADTKERATKQALFQLVVSEIVKAEKLEPKNEEFEAKIEEIANQTKQSKEDVMKTRATSVYSEIVYNKVVDLVLSSAKEI